MEKRYKGMTNSGRQHMKLDKHKLLMDLAILLLPMLVIFLLTPILPEQISIHRGIHNQSIDKHFAFLLGAIPFVVYKIKTRK